MGFGHKERKKHKSGRDEFHESPSWWGEIPSNPDSLLRWIEAPPSRDPLRHRRLSTLNPQRIQKPLMLEVA